MEVKAINSHAELLEIIEKEPKIFLLLHKTGSQQSDCAYNNISKTETKTKAVVLSANVATVRDIHGQYGVQSAPTLLVFEHQTLKNTVKGCNDASYYRSLIDNEVFVSQSNADEKPQKRVTVYSTPTCSWCTRLKDYLKSQNVKFRDVDVSKDQAAAEAMVKRSGQQGVPQTDINGQMIIGFDKPKIDQLLGLN